MLKSIYFNSKYSIFVTDLCLWPGWGGAAAAPWRSPRAAPQLAGLGGGRTGRCGPGSSVGVTPTHPPFPDPSPFQLLVPQVWETAAHRCPRRLEEPGMSLACRCPDLVKQRRSRGVKGQPLYQWGLQRSMCVTWSEKDGYKGELLDTVMEGSWAGKTKFLISPLKLLVEG